MWSWTPRGRWELHRESELSVDKVMGDLAHLHEFALESVEKEDTTCLGNLLTNGLVNDIRLSDLREKYFKPITFNFDTRNYTIYNNSEYLQVLPVPEEFYQYREQVHADDTDYYVEVFFVPNNNPDKYMVIDSIELQDLTLRDHAAIGTGHGVRTKGNPLRPFVKEDKLYLEKEELREVLKFYNGLAGLGTGVYDTTTASRDATLTSEEHGTNGGSRLNYRINPDWTTNTKQATFNNYTSLQFDN
jgi:hypothetical protein